MQSTVITVIIVFDKVVPEMDFELMLNKFKRFVQVNNWNGIPKSGDTKLKTPCISSMQVLAGGILTNNYKFSEADEKQRSGRFWGGNNNIWEAKYRERYWRESIFTGVDCIKESLNGAYGSDKVSIADAAVRWMVHHSQLDPKYGDGIIVGGSSLEHITDNLDALHHESLDPNVVKAFDQAWEYDKANCATYFR